MTSIVILSVITMPVVAVAPSWSVTYGDQPIEYGDEPYEITASVHEIYDSYSYYMRLDAGLGVCIYQYQEDFQHNTVNIRVALQVNSECNEFSTIDLGGVTFFVEKDSDGCGLGKQAIEWELSSHDPMVQAQRLEPMGQADFYDTANNIMGHWAWDALSIAVGVACPEAGLAMELIELGSHFLPTTHDTYTEADYSYSETQARFYWVSEGNAFGTFDAYAFNCFRWKQQLGYNPTTYMQLKIFAVFDIFTNPPNVIPTQYTVGPIYLRINHEGSSGGGGGCPFLSVYDGDSFVSEGKLDIHNRPGVDINIERTLETTPQRIKDNYYFRLREESFHFSEIDNVQLWAVMSDGRIHRLPLIAAIHSNDGSVKRALRRSDDIRCTTLGQGYNSTESSEYIDLAFGALPPGLKPSLSHFVFHIEGFNAKLW